MPSSRGSSQPRDQTWVSLHCRQIFYCLSCQGSPQGTIREGELEGVGGIAVTGVKGVSLRCGYVKSRKS